MAFLGPLLSMGLPILGNIVKAVAPGLIDKLPDAVKGIAGAIVPGLVDSGVKAITRGAETEGSLGDKFAAGGQKFISSALKNTKHVLQNANQSNDQRLINNQQPVYVRQPQYERPSQPQFDSVERENKQGKDFKHKVETYLKDLKSYADKTGDKDYYNKATQIDKAIEDIGGTQADWTRSESYGDGNFNRKELFDKNAKALMKSVNMILSDEPDNVDRNVRNITKRLNEVIEILGYPKSLSI